MTDAKRHRLPRLERTTDHPGLVLDRYLEKTGDKHESAKALYDVVRASPPSELYREAFARWEQTLTALKATVKPFTVLTRLIVGLGGESVRETGITLHRTYGLPYIPGSALKGLVARYARSIEIDPAKRAADPCAPGLTREEREVLTGTPDNAGFVTYFDAWYIARPWDAAGSPFRHDVITVHHPLYYASRGTLRAPWDFDDPTPVPFVTAAGRYLIALRCAEDPTEDHRWEKLALAVLTRALRDWGVGAKTSSGYGRLTPDGTSAASPAGQPVLTTAPPAPPPAPVGPRLSPEADALRADIRGLTADDLALTLDWYVAQCLALPAEAERRTVARVLIGALDAAGLLRALASRAAVKTLLSAVEVGP